MIRVVSLNSLPATMHTNTPLTQLLFARFWYSLLFLVAGLASVEPAAAQDIPDSRGREFWITYLPNFHNNPTALEDSLFLFITAEEETSGVIEYFDRDGRRFEQQFTIDDVSEVYKFQTVYLNFELEGYNTRSVLNWPESQNESVARQVFHITCDKEVTVYGLNQARTTSDAFLGLPQDVLGSNYVIMSYNSDLKTQGATLTNNSTPSQFAVIGTVDNTEVTIDPSVPTQANGMARQSVTLDRGEVYLVQSRFSPATRNADLTGTRVTSTAPIAVFAGHQRATIPIAFANQLISRDHIVQQLLPVNTWGRNAFIIPLPRLADQAPIGSDLYRVLAAVDNTSIFVNGVQQTVLDGGEFFEAPIAEALVIEATGPIQVAQFKQTAGDTPNDLRVGDPFMMLIPPAEQYLRSYRFINAQVAELNGGNNTNIFTRQFVSIIVPSASIGSVRLDGSAVNAGEFAQIADSDWSYATLEVSDGVHDVLADVGLGIYVHGYGGANSYGYIGGVGQENIACTIESGPRDARLCVGESVKLDLRIVGDTTKDFQIIWEPEEGLDNPRIREPIASPKETTTYTVRVTDGISCDASDTVTVFVLPPPELELNGRDKTICEGEETQLLAMIPASGDKATFSWRPTEGLSASDIADPFASPETTTRYYVTGTDTNGCVAVDSVLVTVRRQPEVTAGGDLEICAGSAVRLIARVTGEDDGMRIRWTPTEGLSDPAIAAPLASPEETTTYIVEAIDRSGCNDRDTIVVSVVPQPVLLAGEDIAICVGDSVALKVELSGSERNAKFRWTPELGLSNPRIADPIAKPEETTTYVVEGFYDDDCVAVDTITVAVEFCDDCDEIGGIINEYAAVSAINFGSRSIVIDDTTGFAPGMQILLIQMQGALIDPEDRETYGEIRDFGGAGLYEYGIIESVAENVVVLQEDLQHDEYNTQGRVQILTVPQYNHIIVSGELTCEAWNGETGGVLALAANCLMLEADLDVSAKGFRGGAYENNPPCNVSPHTLEYIKDEDCFWSRKGEGIAGYGVEPFVYGRGAPANAGGGGNNHNSGGGGGGNFGVGGKGGYGYWGVLANRRLPGGFGGKQLYDHPRSRSGRVFLGGGGGAGHSNHGHGSGGANGGGIVLLRAGTINNTGDFSISARGAKADDDYATLNPDGLGGGGAGGSVVLTTEHLPHELRVDVSGGKGGSRLGIERVTSGPGGGGGGGVVFVNGNSDDHDRLVVNAQGGAPGSEKSGDNFGAQPGAEGGMRAALPSVGDLAQHSFLPCRGCYPVLSNLSGGCGEVSFRAVDGGSPVEIIELVDDESENVDIDVSGLASISVAVRISLLDDNQPGSYKLRVRNAAGRESEFSGTILPRPARPVIALTQGRLLSTEAEEYQWRYEGRDIRNNGDQREYTPESEGNYTVLIRDANGCQAESLPFEYRILTNVGDDQPSSLTIYPNPNAGRFTLRQQSDLPGKARLSLTNLLGAPVYEAELQQQDGRLHIDVDISSLPSGMYIVHLRQSGHTWIAKIVKE